MSEEPKISVFYEKFYIDSISKHIPNLFETNDVENICIKRYWIDSIDAFYSYNCITYFTCLHGDVRLIFPYLVNDVYKYKQYFISEMDGKVLKLPYNTLFGINNISNSQSIIMEATSKKDITIKTENSDIFDWS